MAESEAVPRRKWASLEAELDAMEAADPKLKALGDRIRGVVPRRERIREASKARQAAARRSWAAGGSGIQEKPGEGGRE